MIYDDRYFTIPGAPFGKQRPQHRGRQSFTPQKTVNYENMVLAYYKVKYGGGEGTAYFIPQHVPISIDVVAYFGIAKSTTREVNALIKGGIKRPCKVPDVDNILKIVCDALNKQAWHDDCAIVDAHIRKEFAIDGVPRVEIKIKIADAKQ